jgi:hypothetical protein
LDREGSATDSICSTRFRRNLDPLHRSITLVRLANKGVRARGGPQLPPQGGKPKPNTVQVLVSPELLPLLTSGLFAVALPPGTIASMKPGDILVLGSWTKPIKDKVDGGKRLAPPHPSTILSQEQHAHGTRRWHGGQRGDPRRGGS